MANKQSKYTSEKFMKEYDKYMEEFQGLLERFQYDPNAPEILRAIYNERGSRVFIVTNPDEKEMLIIKSGKSKVIVI